MLGAKLVTVVRVRCGTAVARLQPYEEASPHKKVSETEGSGLDSDNKHSLPQFLDDSITCTQARQNQTNTSQSLNSATQLHRQYIHNGQDSKAQEEAYASLHKRQFPIVKTASDTPPEAAPHSRAARRAASPSIPVPEVKRTRSTSPKPSEAKHHVLSTQNAGISKRKNTKMTRAQRVRAEKAMERAADDMDKWEKKKAKSIEKARGIKERAKVWDDINGESVSVVKKGKSFAALAEDGDEEKKGKESVWVDVGDDEMDDAEKNGAVQAVEPEKTTSVAPPVEEDELL